MQLCPCPEKHQQLPIHLHPPHLEDQTPMTMLLDPARTHPFQAQGLIDSTSPHDGHLGLVDSTSPHDADIHYGNTDGGGVGQSGNPLMPSGSPGPDLRGVVVPDMSPSSSAGWPTVPRTCAPSNPNLSLKPAAVAGAPMALAGERRKTTAVSVSMSREASTVTNTFASPTSPRPDINDNDVRCAAMSPSSDPCRWPEFADAVNRRPTLKAPRKSMALSGEVVHTTTAVVSMSGEVSTITNTLASSETTSGQHIHHDCVESPAMSPSSDPSRWRAFADAVNRRPTLKAPRRSMATTAVMSMSEEASTITNTLASSEILSGQHIHHDSVESAAMPPSSDPSRWPAFADAVNRRPTLKAPRQSMATTAVVSMSGEASTITNTLAFSETTSGQHIHHDSVESAAMSPSSDQSRWPAFADAVNRRPTLKAPRKSLATTAVVSMSGEASIFTNTRASSETLSGQHIHHDSVESAAMSPSSDPSRWPAFADAVNRRPTLKAPRKSLATTAVVSMSGEASIITNTLASSETTSGQHIHHDSVESAAMSPSSDPSRWPEFADAVNRRPTVKAPRKSMALSGEVLHTTTAVVSMSGEASTITNTLASSETTSGQHIHHDSVESAAMSPSSDSSRWPAFADAVNRRPTLKATRKSMATTAGPPRILPDPPRILPDARRILPAPPRILLGRPRILADPPRILPGPPSNLLGPPRILPGPPRILPASYPVVPAPPRAVVFMSGEASTITNTLESSETTSGQHIHHDSVESAAISPAATHLAGLLLLMP